MLNTAADTNRIKIILSTKDQLLARVFDYTFLGCSSFLARSRYGDALLVMLNFVMSVISLRMFNWPIMLLISLWLRVLFAL